MSPHKTFHFVTEFSIRWYFEHREVDQVHLVLGLYHRGTNSNSWDCSYWFQGFRAEESEKFLLYLKRILFKAISFLWLCFRRKWYINESAALKTSILNQIITQGIIPIHCVYSIKLFTSNMLTCVQTHSGFGTKFSMWKLVKELDIHSSQLLVHLICMLPGLKSL